MRYRINVFLVFLLVLADFSPANDINTYGYSCEQDASLRAYQSDVIDVFSFRSVVFFDNKYPTVIQFPDTSIEHKSFLIHSLNVIPFDFYQRYRDKKDRHVMFVNNTELMRQKIYNTPNSIGYIYDQVFYNSGICVYKLIIE